MDARAMLLAGMLMAAITVAAATTSSKVASSFDWSGFKLSHIKGLKRPLLVAIGSKGFAACGYIDIATTDKLGDACIIFTGVNEFEDLANSEVKKVSAAAAALGCREGMRGYEALNLLRWI